MLTEKRLMAIATSISAMMVVVLGVLVARRFDWTSAEPMFPPAMSNASQMRTSSELIMVVVGAHGCAASNDPSLPPALQRIREGLAAAAAKEGLRFAVLGIAVDPEPSDGLAYLSKLGLGFDEIATGRNWLGLGPTVFLFRDQAGPPTIPQVLVLSRTVEVQGQSGVMIGADRILARKTGLDGVSRWAADGVPLDLGTVADAGEAARRISMPFTDVSGRRMP